MSGATYCEFYVEGQSGELGSYQMYTPPVIGDDVTFDDGETYTVVRRNADMRDNRVRITLRRKDDT